jgi:enoyl-CoA hydratase/carnithine racemase
METITYTVDGPVATITLNRPQVRNAMNGRMIEELRQTLEAVNLDTAVRVVVLRG